MTSRVKEEWGKGTGKAPVKGIKERETGKVTAREEVKKSGDMKGNGKVKNR